MLYVLQTCSVGWHSEELVTTNIHVVNTCTLCMGSFYLPIHVILWCLEVLYIYITKKHYRLNVDSSNEFFCVLILEYKFIRLTQCSFIQATTGNMSISLCKPVAISDPHRWDALRRLWITFIILFMYTIHSTHQFTIVALRIFGRFWHQNSKWFIAGWL